MKEGNRYRSERKEQMRKLESSISWRERFLSQTALIRGIKKLIKASSLIIWSTIVLAILVFGAYFFIVKIAGLNVEHVIYQSRGIISQEQALEIAGVDLSKNNRLVGALDNHTLRQRLEEHPCIDTAEVHVEIPDTIRMEVNEYLPVLQVEQESALQQGHGKRFFMSPCGTIFPQVAKYHQVYTQAPIWYLRAKDCTAFNQGAKIDASVYRPIIELVVAYNKQDAQTLALLPRLVEIFRPKDWKLQLTLEGGMEVILCVYDIEDQIARLVMILEHARLSGRQVRSINVISRTNPTVIYSE